MLKELTIAKKNGHMVSIHTIDGAIVMGIPEKTSMQSKVKLRNEMGVTYIPYEDLVHVMRLIQLHK